jgi:hypothetical protein
MKKYLIMLMTAVAVLASCGEENLLPENEIVQQPPVTFNLTANHPDATKAVKTGWEEGDTIFVFFNNVAAPKYLKMTYNGASWASAEYNGATQTDGALGLKDGDTGTMRAVFLPFGSNATVSADGTSFVFSTTYYAYYLTATLDYTVINGMVSGAFNMSIPDGYVQFFIEDESATDGDYALGTDAVIPVGVASIDKDGNVVETSDKVAGNDMLGYAYDNGTDLKGYLFTGKLNGDYHSYVGDGSSTVEANAYYFAKTKTSDNTRFDYFVSGKTIASHSAVKLPANGNTKWQSVGSGIYYELKHILDAGTPWESETTMGKWYTCNYGCTVPEQLGTLYTFDDANALGVSLPTKDQFELINNSSYCSYTWLTVHGQQGVVIKADRGFLFLPAQDSSLGDYWSSTEHDSDYAWYFYFYFASSGVHDIDGNIRNNEFAVRPFQN